MMNRPRLSITGSLALLVALSSSASVFGQTPTPPKPDFPPHATVLAEYTKVVSTADNSQSLYTLYKHKKEQQLLAELPASFVSQRYFIAMTVASGDGFAGYQQGDLYFYWRRYGKRLAMISPQIDTRSTGDEESQASVKRLFTDQVLLDVPILTLGPTGGPVIDLNSLLVNQSSFFFGSIGRIANPFLVTVKKAKAFPQNVEIAFEAPVAAHSTPVSGKRVPGGTLKTLHYSISLITSSPGYKPRAADARIGYFTTSYTDLGKYKDTETRTRYITRWNLQKRDPKLALSPPVTPITFYMSHTVPVRYRRWVREGILSWNKAYEKIGFLNAIEVDYQDAQTGRNMDLDPEDVRYNFIRWLNNDIGTAIGPSRVNPMTGEILDADIILTDGWIRHYFNQFTEVLPAVAMEGFNAESMAWFATHPNWDPRVRLAAPASRREVAMDIQRQAAQRLSGHPAGNVDGTFLGDDQFDGLIGRSSQSNGLCMAAQGKKLDMALAAMQFALLNAAEDDDDDKDKDKEKDKDKKQDGKDEEKKDDADKKDADKKDDDKKDGDKEAEEKKDTPKPSVKKVPMLDGMPEEFIGPLLAELVAHEVGHTLGLRHNFKASTIYDVSEVNSEKVKGKKPLAGSVMDYLPVNIKVDNGEIQGDYAMIGIGPYDEWAIEYGYTLESDLKPVLARVGEPELVFGTDEETGGPDPRARRHDFGKRPLDYANGQMKLIQNQRKRLVEKFVNDGESWARARYGYELTLSIQMRSTSMMANWLGGAYTSRARKGDKDAPLPVIVVPVKDQRDALQFVIANMFFDDAFGLSPELINHLGVDKWLDDDSLSAFTEEETWQVHDRVMGMQASTLSMILDPVTLRRVYDNEFRLPADQDALTLPEVLSTVGEAIWQELNENPKRQYTSRVPMVSSLRRNLQQEHLDRLIDLSIPGKGGNEAFKAVANLASMELDGILKNVNRILSESRKRVDPYTLSHLEKIKEQITKAKDGQFIYNAQDVGGGGGGGFIFFREESRAPQGRVINERSFAPAPTYSPSPFIPARDVNVDDSAATPATDQP
ncbi:MAG: zinc-dependent metalloprotease [Planctomycetota bacterium]|nr:zinc-dependent metalloprotease [Planctomycetota bacterium]